MSRSYSAMRGVLAVVNDSRRMLEFDDFEGVEPHGSVRSELKRLKRDGLIDGAVEFGSDGICITCAVSGLTDEGVEFFKLIENDRAWKLILRTLKDADIDIPYPLLKEVCEEIVKRYVTSFIPEM